MIDHNARPAGPPLTYGVLVGRLSLLFQAARSRSRGDRSPKTPSLNRQDGVGLVGDVECLCQIPIATWSPEGGVVFLRVMSFNCERTLF